MDVANWSMTEKNRMFRIIGGRLGLVDAFEIADKYTGASAAIAGAAGIDPAAIDKLKGAIDKVQNFDLKDLAKTKLGLGEVINELGEVKSKIDEGIAKVKDGAMDKLGDLADKTGVKETYEEMKKVKEQAKEEAERLRKNIEEKRKKIEEDFGVEKVKDAAEKMKVNIEGHLLVEKFMKKIKITGENQKEFKNKIEKAITLITSTFEGRRMLNNIVNSNHDIEIAEPNDNSCGYANPDKRWAGQGGTDVIVNWNSRDTSVGSWKRDPSFGLSHELKHAEDAMYGKMKEGSETINGVSEKMRELDAIDSTNLIIREYNEKFKKSAPERKRTHYVY